VRGPCATRCGRRARARGERGPWLAAKQEGGRRGLSGVREQGRGEGRRRKEGKEERKEEKKEREKGKKKRNRREREKEKREREREKGRGASAPIAATIAVGQPRASVVCALREKYSITPALIAEGGRA
jgi:hypothetical protein